MEVAEAETLAKAEGAPRRETRDQPAGHDDDRASYEAQTGVRNTEAISQT